MPRRENHLDPAGGPLAAFACDLRSLRQQAGGPTYRVLAEKTGISTTVLSQAAGGQKMPTWRVTAAYVRACSGDEAAWHKRWAEVTEAIKPTNHQGQFPIPIQGGQTSTPEVDNTAALDTGSVDRPPEVSGPQKTDRLATSVSVPTSSPSDSESTPADSDLITTVIDPALGLSRSEFSEQLTALREQAGLSMRELRSAINREVPLSTLGGWFSGRTPARPVERVFVSVLRACGVEDPEQIQQWLDAARRLKRHSPITGIAPYRGLEPFSSEDAEWFFGRDAAISPVIDALDRLRSSGGGIQLLLGASGSGKSSLLQAGVIPRLRQTADLGLDVVFSTPGPKPMTRLAEVLKPWVDVLRLERAETHQGDPDASTIDALEHPRLRGETSSSTDVAARSDGTPSPEVRTQLVVAIDQFEEVFTACSDDTERRAYVATLAALATRPAGAIVLLTLRADFYVSALSYAELAKAASSAIVVRPMSLDELREAIAEPARKAHITIDDALVEVLLRDVTTPAGQATTDVGVLPLLSHALHNTWLRRAGHRMTLDGYRAIGGIAGSVATSADQAYADLSPAQQGIARRLFLSLVDVHSSGVNTCRQVPLDGLFAEIEGGGTELEVVLDRFVSQRLLIVDEETVKITHDALLVAWVRLRTWLDADRSGRLVAQQLNSDARAWDQAGRPASDLYHGTRLHAAREWGEKYPTEITTLSRMFLDAAVRQSRRTTRRLQLTIAVLVVLLVIASTLVAVVFTQAQSLQLERDQAQSRRLAALASTLRGQDVALARQLALAAYRISPTTEARSTLIDATALRPAVRMQAGEDVGIMGAVGVHPGGTIVAAAVDNNVQLWDITKSGHPMLRPDPPGTSCNKIYALAFSPNGNLLAAACGDGSIHLWDTHDPMAPVELPALTNLNGAVRSVAFSPDGSMMAATSGGRVRMWRLSGVVPAPLGQLRVGDNASATSVSFHPSNNYLAVGTTNGTVQTWDISTPDRPTNLVSVTGSTKEISQVAFSPDGTKLAAGGADFLVHLWSTTDPRTPHPAGPPIAGAKSWVNAISFSPDGTTLAIASSDATVGVRLLDLANRRVIATMPHPTLVTSVKFSADGKTVISGANDGTARLWPVAAPTLTDMDYIVSSTRFSPDGTTLAMGSDDLRLLDVTNPQQPTPYGPPLSNPDDFSGALAFAPNNRLLAEGRGKSGTVQLWNVTNPSKPIALGPPLHAHSIQVNTVAFNSDGTVLATGSRDGAVQLWNVQVPEAPVLLSVLWGFDGSVNEVSFSPNGKLLVAGSTDTTVRLWDVSDTRTPKLVGYQLTPANHYVNSTVFSPDGTMLAIGLADNTIRLYDLTNPANPKQIGSTLTGPEHSILSLSFTTDGTTLAAASNDGTVWIWDVRNRDKPTVFATLTLATDTVYSVQFQPHTHVLVAGGTDKTAWIWTTNVNAAAALVCDTSGEAITREEWAKFIPDHEYQPPCPA